MSLDLDVALPQSGPPPEVVPGEGGGAFVSRLRQIVGGEHVLASAADAARYSRCTIPWDTRCAAIVRPANTREVCDIVRLARAFRLPLWPFSRGHNWGYGTTLALRDGAVILLLERMNRILEVNEELAYAVIEPGVSQKQLNDYLRDQGHKLWTDCTDSTPDGSVLGNALERGVGYTPYGDHFGALCGLEVVLPSGEILHTGGGPGDSPTWNTYKWGVGPYLEGLFSQSNLGIVTRGGVWLMPTPEAFNVFTLEVPDRARFPAVIDAVRRLALQRTISNVHCFNDFLLMTSLMQYPYELRGCDSRLSEATREQFRDRFGLTPWTMVGGIYGTAAQVRAHRALIRRELAAHGKLMFLGDRKVALLDGMIHWMRRTATQPIAGPFVRLLKRLLFAPQPLETLEALTRIYPIMKGIPGEFVVRAAYFKRRQGRETQGVDPPRDRCGFTWFVPVVPATGDHVRRVQNACAALFEQHGFEFPLSVILVNPRSVLMCMPIIYDRDDGGETGRAAALYEAVTETTLGMGYQQYRTSIAGMERILRPAPAVQRLAATLKQTLDPDHILAPGRYGLGAE